MYIDIEGIPQWLRIDGDAPQNPVLLLVHGGPGASTGFAADAWRPWRRHFTLVHWDQRGAARTLARNGAEGSEPMSFAQIVADGLGVAEFLRAHLGKQRIALLGHSWGSAVAVHMVRRRPDLFSAFIGTGLLVNFVQNERALYERELQQARRAHNQAALTVLTELGQPPYANIGKLKVLREWADRLTDGKGDPPQPTVKPPADFSAEDSQAMLRGFVFSATRLYRDLLTVDLPSLGLDFEVPMYCLMGTHDQQTPIELAENYFETIAAPQKRFVRFEGCHHFVHMNRPDAFLDALLDLSIQSS